MSKGTLLLVEDDVDLRESVAEILSFADYEICTAANGIEALKLIHAGYKPDAVLTDLMMPLMDGFELIAHLRKEEIEHLPIIVLSASYNRAETKTGADVFLSKPFTIDELTDSIDAVLHASRV